MRSMGLLPVFRDKNGELVVKTGGNSSVGNWGLEGDIGGDIGDDFEGDLEGDIGDELEGVIGEAIGRAIKEGRLKRLRKREGRRDSRNDKREQRFGKDIDGDGDVAGKGGGVRGRYTDPYQFGASSTVTAAGTYSQTLTPTADCLLDSLVLDAPAGTAVTQIQIGREVIVTGVSAATLYSSTSTKNSLLKGRMAKAGVPVNLQFTTTATSGAIISTMVGNTTPSC